MPNGPTILTPYVPYVFDYGYYSGSAFVCMYVYRKNKHMRQNTPSTSSLSDMERSSSQAKSAKRIRQDKNASAKGK